MVLSEPKFVLLRKTSGAKNGKERVLETFVFRNATQFYTFFFPTQGNYKKSISYVAFSCTRRGTECAKKRPSCLYDLNGSLWRRSWVRRHFDMTHLAICIGHTRTAHSDDGRSETISSGKCCTHTQKYLRSNSFDGTVTYWQVCHHRPTRSNHPSNSVACPIMSLRLHTALCWITQIRACVISIPGTETVIKVWPDITNPSCSICKTNTGRGLQFA
jgi:hypothetical protein